MKVEGFFNEMKAAKETVEKLKKAGFEKTYLDMNDHYIDDRNVETNLAGTEMSTSLSALVLESDSSGSGKGISPLTAANPMVSGFGNFEEIADISCKVVVETGETNKDRISSIIQNMGGTLENPNIIKPKLAYDKDFTIHKPV